MNICLAVFCYNREKHLKSTLDALLQNPNIREYPINFFIDGPVKKEDEDKISRVYNLINAFDHSKKFIIRRHKNIGLADNIITGLNHSFKTHDAVIVLEDDVVVNEHFLNYMVTSLCAYSNDDNVWHISAWSPITHIKKNVAYFSHRMACSGGWATWKRAWKHFNRDVEIIDSLQSLFFQSFDPNKKFGYKKQLIYNKKNIIKTWGIYWSLIIFMKKKLCLNPLNSFTKNIGFDGSGVHSNKSTSYNNLVISGIYPIEFPNNVDVNKFYTKEYENALVKLGYTSLVTRIINKIKKLLGL